jgi:hypothetical protein
VPWCRTCGNGRFFLGTCPTCCPGLVREAEREALRGRVSPGDGHYELVRVVDPQKPSLDALNEAGRSPLTDEEWGDVGDWRERAEAAESDREALVGVLRLVVAGDFGAWHKARALLAEVDGR